MRKTREHRGVAVPNTTQQHPRQKVTTEQVKSYLSARRSIRDVASKFNVTPATARKHILTLVEQTGQAKKVGTRPQADGRRGRPADLYQVNA